MLVHDLTFYPAKHLHGIPERARESIKDRNKNLSCQKLLPGGETLKPEHEPQVQKDYNAWPENKHAYGIAFSIDSDFSIFIFEYENF